MNSRHSSGKALVITIGLWSILLTGINASAQFRDNLNLPDHDSKFYHLGIALIYNNSHFQVSAHPQFLQGDTILSINPENTGGFGLAGLHTIKINPHFQFRGVFSQLKIFFKKLTYTNK